MESNPLDFLGRVHSTYPELWFSVLGGLGFTREHEIPLALAINGVFLIILLILLYPRSWAEVLVGFLSICSPATLLAMERCNVDVVIFIVLALVPICFEWRTRVGFPIAWAVLLVATAFKYYPVTGYILFLKNAKELRVLFCYALLAVVAVAAYFALILEDSLLVPQNLQKYGDPVNVYTFGAKGFFYFATFNEQYAEILAWLAFLVLLCGSALVAKKTDFSLPPSSNWRENFFLLGVAVSSFTFIMIWSYDYRTIFLLFTLPYLLDLAKNPAAANREKVVARALTAFLLTMMWIETAYLFIVLDPIQRQWNVIGLRYLFLVKHGLAWVVMAMMIALAFLVLKPNVKQLEMGFPRLGKEKSV